MSYNELSAAAQRVELVTDGYRKTVTVDKYDMREAAWSMGDIASEAFGDPDPAKGILAFSVFAKAAKQARLKPIHVARWLARLPGGAAAIVESADAIRRGNNVHAIKQVA